MKHAFTLQLCAFSLHVLLLIGCGDKNSVSAVYSPCDALEDNQLLRIIGGEPCAEGSTGGVVKLTLFDEEDNPSLCSGTLIAPQWVLSAGHCFPEFILGGEVTGGDVTAQITSISVHPEAQLSGDVYYNDSALIKLDRELPMNSVSLSESSPEVGEKLYIYGYGASDSNYSGREVSGILRGGVMEVTSVTPQIISAAYKGNGDNFCYGDSGGPAFVERNGRFFQVGIISTGSSERCEITGESFFTNNTDQETRNFITSTLLSE